MNEEILIELGEVSEDTKGCPGGIVENVNEFNEHEELPDENCP